MFRLWPISSRSSNLIICVKIFFFGHVIPVIPLVWSVLILVFMDSFMVQSSIKVIGGFKSLNQIIKLVLSTCESKGSISSFAWVGLLKRNLFTEPHITRRNYLLVLNVINFVTFCSLHHSKLVYPKNTPSLPLPQTYPHW